MKYLKLGITRTQSTEIIVEVSDAFRALDAFKKDCVKQIDEIVDRTICSYDWLLSDGPVEIVEVKEMTAEDVAKECYLDSVPRLDSQK